MDTTLTPAEYNKLVNPLASPLDKLPADSPRAKGYNYGVGWSNAPFLPIYKDCDAVAARLRHAATVVTHAAWAVDMLLRNARLADTPAERVAAVAALEAWYKANDPRDSKGDPTPNYSYQQIAAILPK